MKTFYMIILLLGTFNCFYNNYSYSITETSYEFLFSILCHAEKLDNST